MKRSTNPKDPYGTFSVEVRDYHDTDTNPRILELYPNCTLNPASENYVARLIGDFKAYYDFDAEVESERRLQVTGKHANRSRFVRIVMDPQIENSNNVPKEPAAVENTGVAFILIALANSADSPELFVTFNL